MQKQSYLVTCLTAVALAVGLLGLSARDAQAGIYDADTEVTYKEYWVHHSQFTGSTESNAACHVHSNPNGTFYLEPTGNCTMAVKLNIPESLARATRAEIYIDLWRNRTPTYTAGGALDKKASALFKINNNDTWFETHPHGSDWSRTPMLAETVHASDANGQVIPASVRSVLGLLVQGENIITIRQTTGLYHIHAISVRVYFDPANPLLGANGQPISVPNGSLTTVAAQNGTFNANAGGNLTVNNDQVTLTANLSTNAKYIEFHGYYRGYDLENDDRDGDQGALDTKWQNRVRNHWHSGGRDEQDLGGTIDHIGTVAAATPGNYSTTWNMAHILSQPGVKFKIRIVTADNVVREAAGGVSGGFNLQRTGHVFAYTQTNWQDFVLHHGGNRPQVVDTSVFLPCDYDANQYNSAWVLGSYWNNPFLNINGASETRVFSGQDNWTLSVLSINRTHLNAGNNTFTYKYPGTGFGQFIEKPGPLVVLKRTSALPAGGAPPQIVSRTPAPGATNVAVNTNIVVTLRDTGVGVDLNSLRMLVNGSRVQPTLACVGTPATDYRLTYALPANHPNNTTVQVRVEACDLAGNCIDESHTFETRLSQHAIGNDKSGSGSVQLTPTKANYNYGETVALASTPADDWLWMGRSVTIADWADAERDYRLPVNVAANGFPRFNKRADIALNFTNLFNTIGQANSFNRDSLRVVEVNSAGQVTDANVPFVFTNGSGYNANTNAHGILTIQIKGSTAANGVRYYHLYWDITAKSFTPPNHTVPADVEPILRPLVIWPGGPQTQSLGNAPGGPNTTFKVTASANLMTTFEAGVAYTLATSVNGSGSIEAEPNNATYAPGDEVVLTATANPGSLFTGWSGDASGDEPSITLTMNANKTITANFTDIPYTVATAVVGGGTIVKEPEQAIYHYGDVVTLTATANPGSLFTGWSGNLSGDVNPQVLTIDGDKSLTANFIELHTLTTGAAGQGSVAVSPDLPEYVHGTSVTLTATAETGWLFTGWSGDLSGDANPATLIMESAKSVTATFTPLHALTVTVVGDGGVVERTPDAAAYLAGDEVTLTAIPTPGWRFEGWSDDAQGSALSVTLTMNAPKTVTATFVEEEYTLTLTTQGQGAITADPVKPFYRYGDKVTLSAAPADQWLFMNWSGDATGNENPVTVTISDDTTVNAQFAEDPHTLRVTVTGKGNVVVSPDQPGYLMGGQVTLTAVAEAGWLFIGWSGDLVDEVNPAALIMDADKAITANFGATAAGFVINSVSGGQVKVIPELDADKPFYAVGDEVALEAIPDAGWRFVQWEINAVSSAAGTQTTQNPLTIIVDGGATYQPQFVPLEPGLAANMLYLPVIMQ